MAAGQVLARVKARGGSWHEIKSPIAGQVVKRMVSVGEQVDGTAAQPIAEIANLDRVELAANVPAEYLSRIRVGQSAIVATDALEGRTFPGSVLAIALLGERLQYFHAVGYLLVLAGITLATRR